MTELHERVERINWLLMKNGQCVERVERINWFPTKWVPNELSESTGYNSVPYDMCATS